MDTSLNISTDQKFNYNSNELIETYSNLVDELKVLSKKSKTFLKNSVVKDDRIDNHLLEKFQFQSHGLAWFETYVISLRETLNWYKTLCEKNKESEIDKHILQFAFSEYLMQIKNGGLKLAWQSLM